MFKKISGFLFKQQELFNEWFLRFHQKTTSEEIIDELAKASKEFQKKNSETNRAQTEMVKDISETIEINSSTVNYESLKTELQEISEIVESHPDKLIHEKSSQKKPEAKLKMGDYFGDFFDHLETFSMSNEELVEVFKKSVKGLSQDEAIEQIDQKAIEQTMARCSKTTSLFKKCVTKYSHGVDKTIFTACGERIKADPKCSYPIFEKALALVYEMCLETILESDCALDIDQLKEHFIYNYLLEIHNKSLKDN